MRIARTVLIVALCAALVALWGCPPQQTQEAGPEDVTPPAGDAEMAPDEDQPAEDDADADHEPGEHMDEGEAGHEGHMHGDHEPGEHMDDGSEASLSGEVEDGTRVVEVEAKRYEFVPSPIVVKAGEPVRLEVTATDTDHGFGIEAFEIEERLPQGETQTIEFTPDESGEYHIHCTVYCGPGHSDMHGTLVVRE
jgi:cytochrome c oxidase subunit 2